MKNDQTTNERKVAEMKKVDDSFASCVSIEC
jgi:hypothetical protein